MLDFGSTVGSISKKSSMVPASIFRVCFLNDFSKKKTEVVELMIFRRCVLYLGETEDLTRSATNFKVANRVDPKVARYSRADVIISYAGQHSTISGWSGIRSGRPRIDQKRYVLSSGLARRHFGLTRK